MKTQVNEIYLQPGEYFWGGENNRVKTLLGSCVAICIWHPKLKIGGMSHCLLPSRGHGGPRVGERRDAQEPTVGKGGPGLGVRTDAQEPSRGHGGPGFDEHTDVRQANRGHGGPGFAEHTDVRQANRGHGGPGFAELSGKYVDECLEIFFREMVRAGTRKQDYVVKVFGGGNMFELKDPSGATVGERNIEMIKTLLARESMAITAEHIGGKGHRNVIFELWNGDCWVKHADLLLPTGNEST